MQRALTESERERHNSSEQLSELNTQLARLTDSLGRDRLSDELRGELRLLSRTIAAAVDGKRGAAQ
jgi:hypothetical protein